MLDYKQFITVETKAQLRALVGLLADEPMVAFDVEANGLDPYHNDIIGMSWWFPEAQVGYYLPTAHGIGEVEIRYTSKNHKGLSYQDLTWQGNTKSDLYLREWWLELALDYGRDFGNVPISWADEVRKVFPAPGQTVVFHNALFDLAYMHTHGFRTPDAVEDTMIWAHVLNQDWGGTRFEKQWFYNQTKGWHKATKNGNRQLKWLAKLYKLDGAFEGEEGLENAARRLEDELASLAMTKPHDWSNEGLWYGTSLKLAEEGILHGDVSPGTALAIEDWQLKAVQEASVTDKNIRAWGYTKDITNELIRARWGRKQYNRLRSKFKVDTKANMWMLDASEVSLYAILDTKLTWELREKFKGLYQKYWGDTAIVDMLQRHTFLAHRMSVNGLKVDEALARSMMGELESEMKTYTQQFREWSGDPEFNPNSPAQLLRLFRDTLGWDITGTDKDELYDYQDEPEVKALSKLRQAGKAHGTYLSRWLYGADSEGMIHPEFRTTGTVAGRWSSAGRAGNLQNVPDRAYDIKRVLREPDPDNWIIAAIDYGQLELRLAAWVAEVLNGFGNLEMTTLFESGEDMHAYTRDEMQMRERLYPNWTDASIMEAHDISPKLIDEGEHHAFVQRKILRQMAKVCNFGLLYSGTWRMLDKLLRVGEGPSRTLEDGWRTLYPAFKQAQDHYTWVGTQERPSPTGLSRNNGNFRWHKYPLFGYIRMLHHYPAWLPYQDEVTGMWKGFDVREAEARKLWNNIIQGTGGMMLVESAYEFGKRYDDSVWRPFANIHDAIDFRVHRDHLRIVAELAQIMKAYDVRPALTVDLEASPTGNWYDMQEVENFDLWVASRGHGGYENG